VNIALLVQRCTRLVSVCERVAHETSEYTLDNLDPEPSDDGETNSQVETLRLSIGFLRIENLFSDPQLAVTNMPKLSESNVFIVSYPSVVTVITALRSGGV
jgi:hypothetical protein